MKVRLFIFAVLVLFSCRGYCQAKVLNCDEMYKEAKEYAAKEEYEKALNKLNAAKICDPINTKYDKEIIEIYNKINRKKLEAKQAEKKAKKASADLSSANEILKRQKKDLDSAKAILEKQSNFALAIKHSEKSIAIPNYDLGRRTIKAHLALISYQLLLESGQDSSKLQTQIYSSLYDAIKSDIGDNGTASFYWNITSVYQEAADHIAYAALTKDANKRSKIYVSTENSRMYAFDLETSAFDSVAYAASPIDRNKHAKTAVSGDDYRQYAFSADNSIRMKNDPKDRPEIFLSIKASPNGRWTAMNTLSKKLFIIDHTTGLQSFKQVRGISGALKFCLDDSALYAYKQDGGLYKIQLADEKIRSSRRSDFKMEDFTASNMHLYALTDKGIVKLDKNKNNFGDAFTINRPDTNHTGTKIRCTADDRLVVWGNEDGQVYYLKNDSDTAYAQHLASFSGPVTDIAINDSGKLVAIANYDKSIRVFDLLNLEQDVPLILNANEGPVTSVFFNRDNQGKEILVATLSPGFIRIYPMDMKTLACQLYTSYKGKPLPGDISKYVDQAVKKKNIEIPCK